MLSHLFGNKNFLGFLFLLPAAVLLALFLAYPLGLGIWLGFTDTTLAMPGRWVGFENYIRLLRDPIARLAIFNTVFYTGVASIIKFALGLWLALLLNQKIPFKNFFRSAILIPWIVPTALSALAFFLIYSPQLSIISWALMKLGLIDHYIDFLGKPWNARLSVIAMNIWRGIPFVAIMMLAGLQTISPTLYDAAKVDGATAWQRFRRITFPLLLPIIAVAMTFSVIETFIDFQLVYVLTHGGPLNATHLMTTLSFDRAIVGGALGQGAALALMIIPFLLAIILFSYFSLQNRPWQRGFKE